MTNIDRRAAEFRDVLEDLKVMVMQGSFEVKHLEMACDPARIVGHMEGMREGKQIFDKALEKATR